MTQTNLQIELVLQLSVHYSIPIPPNSILVVEFSLRFLSFIQSLINFVKGWIIDLTVQLVLIFFDYESVFIRSV